MEHLSKCDANYAPLTPITFLKRASKCYSDRTSIIYERTRFTWRQTDERCRRLASSLRRLNVIKNDVVSVLASNGPALSEMHFAVPMAGAILNPINTHFDAFNIAVILRHSKAKVFFLDFQYIQQAKYAISVLTAESSPLPLVVAPTGAMQGNMEYEELICGGDVAFAVEDVEDEWDSISKRVINPREIRWKRQDDIYSKCIVPCVQPAI